MSKSPYAYRELLLQWIWANCHFDTSSLITCCKKPIRIEDPGELNPGKGADFLNARIQIGNLLWHGHVEIHNEEKDWFRHHHHEDEVYNGVVLHVFFTQASKRAVRTDGTKPYQLHLAEFVDQPLYNLLERMYTRSNLACSDIANQRRLKPFHDQIKKAKKEYFTYKIEEIRNFYPDHKSTLEAWKTGFILEIYSILGIPRNRDPMIQAGRSLIEFDGTLSESADDFCNRAIESARLNDNGVWHSTGMRPANRPQKRIPQAAAFHHRIRHTSVQTFLTYSEKTWGQILKSIHPERRPGKNIQNLLYGMAFLPSLFLLGEMTGTDQLKKTALDTWLAFETKQPASILQAFKKAGLPAQELKRNPGLSHQFKRYCLPGNCHHCEVFKKVIRS